MSSKKENKDNKKLWEDPETGLENMRFILATGPLGLKKLKNIK